jgi:hypothetical protein
VRSSARDWAAANHPSERNGRDSVAATPDTVRDSSVTGLVSQSECRESKRTRCMREWIPSFR